MNALDSACVVVPTRNEVENVGRLLEALRAQSDALRIIIVDDDSPDGTAQAADALKTALAPLDVICRKGRRGRGSAVRDGFRRALEDPGVNVLVEMDADFSHDPAELTALVHALAEGADMAVGSRYLRESRIVGWPLSRLVFSRLSNIAARALLRLPLSDCTNGYRAYTRRAAEAIAAAAVSSPGFFALSETAVHLRRQGMRLAERPSVFVNRRRGQSNLSLSEIAAAFVSLLRLAMR